jgi:hypothetical protein
VKRAALTLLVFATVPPVIAAPPPSLLRRALSCQLRGDEIPKLMQMLPRQIPEMGAVAQSYAAPSGNFYKLTGPVSALGYSSAEIYIQPARILMLVSGVSAKMVVRKLHLKLAPFSPAARSIRPTATLVSYELHQQGLAGKVLIGCEYADPAALNWLGQPDGERP